jgi:hypothetical protein
MRIRPVDYQNNLFKVENVVSDELVEKVLNTNWLELDWNRQEGQEHWPRRRIKDSSIPWIDQWNQEIISRWPVIETAIGKELQYYRGTAWWLDEPGFICNMHTDGAMPGAMQLTWRGPGTTFYWDKDPSTVRFQTPEKINDGYLMINLPEKDGTRKLLWHAMLTPSSSYRLTSYTYTPPKAVSN